LEEKFLAKSTDGTRKLHVRVALKLLGFSCARKGHLGSPSDICPVCAKQPGVYKLQGGTDSEAPSGSMSRKERDTLRKLKQVEAFDLYKQDKSKDPVVTAALAGMTADAFFKNSTYKSEAAHILNNRTDYLKLTSGSSKKTSSKQSEDGKGWMGVDDFFDRLDKNQHLVKAPRRYDGSC
jgi:hypothetical protein